MMAVRGGLVATKLRCVLAQELSRVGLLDRYRWSRRGRGGVDAEWGPLWVPAVPRAPTRGPTPHHSTPAPTRSPTACVLPTKYRGRHRHNHLNHLSLHTGDTACTPRMIMPLHFVT